MSFKSFTFYKVNFVADTFVYVYVPHFSFHKCETKNMKLCPHKNDNSEI